MRIIKNTEDLAAFCDALAAKDFITVDTEFLRDTTYWPKLCLVQMASDEDAAIIDPLEPGIDLAPLFRLMGDEGVLKVFHAARQDIEIFYHLSGQIPTPLFDTQVAAMVCGYGDSVGYETLVREIADGRVDKSSRFTDWSRRPLGDKQLSYALADVTFLRDIYRALAHQLGESGRAAWVREEMGILTASETYDLDPQNAWARLKLRSTKKRFLACAKTIAAWREREAQSRDVPRNRIIKDDAILELAANQPETREAMAELRAVPRGFANSKNADGILKAIAEGLDLPKNAIPKPARGQGGGAAAPQAVVDLLKVLLKLKCEEHGVAQKLVANAADVERIAGEEDPDVKALAGWRREVYGEDALRLKRGEIALTLQGDKAALLTQ